MRPVMFLGTVVVAVVTGLAGGAADADAGNGFFLRSSPVCLSGNCGSTSVQVFDSTRSSIRIQQPSPQVIVQQSVPEIIVQQQQVPVIIQQQPQIRVNSCFRSRVSVRRGLFGGLRVRVR